MDPSPANLTLDDGQVHTGRNLQGDKVTLDMVTEEDADSWLPQSVTVGETTT